MALYDSNVCGCSSVGRIDVFQTSGHEFEPRYPLIYGCNTPKGYYAIVVFISLYVCIK